MLTSVDATCDQGLGEFENRDLGCNGLGGKEVGLGARGLSLPRVVGTG